MWEFFQDVAGFLLGVLSFLGVMVRLLYEAIRLWAYDNTDIVYGVGAAIVACGAIALVLRSIWHRWLRDRVKPVYWRYLQRPTHRVLAPVRRLHRRWSERNMEKKVAKWKNGLVSDKLYETLLNMEMEGLLSRQESKKYQVKIGKALGLSDLLPRSWSKDAIKHRITSNDTAKHGPKGPIPGGKPGEDIVPHFEGLGDRFLKRHRKTA